MSEEMHINVVIADRPYRLKIKPEEEETVRKAARMINDRVKEYQQAFLSKDKQDFLAMIALQNTVEALKYKDTLPEAGSPLAEKIAQLEELLQQS
jgi:cell division protein ZapA (FtsZ GTPase activity inhibitor)